MSPNRKKHREAFRKIGEAVSLFVTDPQAGICVPHSWAVRKSAGFDVLQIATTARMSKLEKRSESEVVGVE